MYALGRGQDFRGEGHVLITEKVDRRWRCRTRQLACPKVCDIRQGVLQVKSAEENLDYVLKNYVMSVSWWSKVEVTATWVSPTLSQSLSQ
jgi:hypothetical protein